MKEDLQKLELRVRNNKGLSCPRSTKQAMKFYSTNIKSIHKINNEIENNGIRIRKPGLSLNFHNMILCLIYYFIIICILFYLKEEIDGYRRDIIPDLHVYFII